MLKTKSTMDTLKDELCTTQDQLTLAEADRTEMRETIGRLQEDVKRMERLKASEKEHQITELIRERDQLKLEQGTLYFNDHRFLPNPFNKHSDLHTLCVSISHSHYTLFYAISVGTFSSTRQELHETNEQRIRDLRYDYTLNTLLLLYGYTFSNTHLTFSEYTLSMHHANKSILLPFQYAVDTDLHGRRNISKN